MPYDLAHDRTIDRDVIEAAHLLQKLANEREMRVGDLVHDIIRNERRRAVAMAAMPRSEVGISQWAASHPPSPSI